VFSVKVIITGQKYGGIVIEKKNSNLYFALDEVVLVMLERLNRKGDKVRVRGRALLRKQKTAFAG
jgi:ribosome-associated translation inhibitor RaiA